MRAHRRAANRGQHRADRLLLLLQPLSQQELCASAAGTGTYSAAEGVRPVFLSLSASFPFLPRTSSVNGRQQPEVREDKSNCSVTGQQHQHLRDYEFRVIFLNPELAVIGSAFLWTRTEHRLYPQMRKCIKSNASSIAE